MKHTRLFIASAIVLLGAQIFGWLHLPGPRFLGAYRLLRIGMTVPEVQSLFGGEPVYHCRFGRSAIWYYVQNNRFAGTFPPDTPAAGSLYEDSAKLPDVYDHVQIAFDENGKLVAYTWIGETNSVEYSGGSVRGTHFKHLPPGVL